MSIADCVQIASKGIEFVELYNARNFKCKAPAIFTNGKHVILRGKSLNNKKLKKMKNIKSIKGIFSYYNGRPSIDVKNISNLDRINGKDFFHH